MFPEVDNVTVEIEGFATPPQFPAEPSGSQGFNSESLSPAHSVSHGQQSDLLHNSDSDDHSRAGGSGSVGGDALPPPIPVPDILPDVSSDSDEDDDMAPTITFTYDDEAGIREYTRKAALQEQQYQCNKPEDFPQRAHKAAIRAALYVGNPRGLYPCGL